MKLNLQNFKALFVSVLIFGSTELTAGVAQAEPIPPSIQTKIDTYKKQLVEWATDPLIDRKSVV